MKNSVLASLLMSSALLLAACNTVEGAGRDLQSAGQAVEDVAE